MASSSPTPSTLLPASTGVTKPKSQSTRTTTKAKGASSIHRAKKSTASKTKSTKPARKATTKLKALSFSKTSVSSRKNNKYVTLVKQASKSNNAQSRTAKNVASSSESDSLLDSTINPALEPVSEIGPAMDPAAPRRRVKTIHEKRECVVCTNSKHLGRRNANFPKFSNCDHEPLTCTECIMKHAIIRLKARRVASINGGPPSFWSVVTCPQCLVPLTETDIRASLSRKDLKTIGEWVTLNELHNDKRWVWCVSGTCPSGQIHNKATKKDTWEARMVKCVKCGVESCFSHRDVWHKGLTCAQYDDLNPKSESLKTSEERIRNMTKQCPTAGCGWRIQKNGGCSNMLCMYPPD